MNKVSLSLLAVSVTSLFGCQSTSEQNAQAEQTSHASQSVYQVEFDSAQRFAAQTKQLNTTFNDYCQSSASLEELQSQWHSTMASWMALQGQERGPEQALAQSWNVQFWPDKKNTTGRKMVALAKQNKAWTPEEIAQQSVTVQGLGAIEWLLYDKASDLNSAQTCDTGVSISRNLANNAQSISAAWQQNPWKALDEKAWLTEYIALLSNQLEYSMKKLSRPLANFGHPRPYFAESWRSQTSMKNLAENIQAMEALYFAQGNGLDALLRARGESSLADRVKQQFAMTRETWPAEQSLFDMLQTKQGYQRAYAQYNKLEQLKYLIHEEVAVELGVVIGFNATDGD